MYFAEPITDATYWNMVRTNPARLISSPAPAVTRLHSPETLYPHSPPKSYSTCCNEEACLYSFHSKATRVPRVDVGVAASLRPQKTLSLPISYTCTYVLYLYHTHEVDPYAHTYVHNNNWSHVIYLCIYTYV